jgi:hypothetical protein
MDHSGAPSAFETRDSSLVGSKPSKKKRFASNCRFTEKPYIKDGVDGGWVVLMMTLLTLHSSFGQHFH